MPTGKENLLQRRALRPLGAALAQEHAIVRDRKGSIAQPCVASALLPHLVPQVRPRRMSVSLLVGGVLLLALSWRPAGAVIPPPTAQVALSFAGFETPS